jgi:hypothetical protein
VIEEFRYDAGSVVLDSSSNIATVAPLVALCLMVATH